MEIFLFRGDQETGPYTEVETRALVASSQIARTCLAWHEGMDEWLPLEPVVSLPKPPSPPPVAKTLPPVPPRNRAQTSATISVSAAPTPPSSSSTIRTVSGVIALILGLLAIFNIGGCMNASSKLAVFQRGGSDMDTAEMFVDTMRGMSQNDPLRGVSGLMEKAHSLQDDYEGFQVGAWLCVIGAAVAGGVCVVFSRPRTAS